MFCRNCGRQIPDDTTFCGYCGTPVPESDRKEFNRSGYAEEAEPVYHNRLDDIEQYVQEERKRTKKRGFKKVLLIPIIVGIVVILAAAALFIFRDSIFQKDSVTTEGGVQQQEEIAEIPLAGTESQTESANAASTPTAPAANPGSLSVGDTISFGQYESDGNTSNGKEYISWQVLEVDGNKALLITELAIDAMSFSQSGGTWSESTLRQWLNGTFISQAFSAEERSSILPTTVTTKTNPTYGTKSGADCTDEVFILSGEEAAKYFGADSNRKIKGTTYANSNNLFVSKTGYCRWWIRDAGQASGFASVINGDGVVDYFGAPVGESRYGVRPAMWITIE